MEPGDGTEATSRANAPRIRASVPIAIAFAAMLIPQLYLLIFQWAPDAPIRSGGPPAELATTELQLNNSAANISTAADGKNVELHYSGSASEWKHDADFFTTLYYAAVYTQYPRRVFVGTGDHLINNSEELHAADHLPPVECLHLHRVAAVFNLLPINARGPRALVHAVP